MCVSLCGLVFRRIADNPLVCDCRLSWLSKWLRLHTTLGLFTRCASPDSLRGRELAELQQSNFVCNDGENDDSNSCLCCKNLEILNSSNLSMSNLGYIQMSLKDPLLLVSLFCHLASIILCVLILSETSALYKLFTYLLN